MSYILMTDSDSDLPFELQQRYAIPVVRMPYTLNGREYFDDLGQTIDSHAFFQAMRDGAVPTTSALNTEAYLEYFEPVLQKGQDILFIAFSSRMSSTFVSLCEARDQLLERYPERVFRVIDTLSISAPQTLLVLGAC